MTSAAPDPTSYAEHLRERLGPYGVWMTSLGTEPASVERAALREIEQLGFGAYWYGESHLNKEAFAHAAILLAATEKIVVAAGIANIWVRDATAMQAGAAALGEAFDDRYLLGIGVSHAPQVDNRGHDYKKPLTYMARYLDAMDDAPYAGALPAGGVPRVLAALRPKMMKLAGERSAGAHPYLVPAEHTAKARAILGPGPFLAPEQGFVLETDPDKARAIGREHLTFYLTLPNYTNHFRDLGFGDEDFANGGSDRFIDTVVAWGDVDSVVARVRAHHEAGADHVCIQPLTATIDSQLDQLRQIAPALLPA